MTQTDNELLARIDERTETILNRMDDLQDRSDRLDKAVFLGNGQPALMARMSSMETQFAQYLVMCAVCRKIVYAPKPIEQQTPQQAKDQVTLAQVALAAIEGKKTITVEKWKFYGALAAGAFAFLAALVAALSGIIK
jgi:hypothetical protein